MIAKQALTLVKRLNDLKNSQNKEPKQLKNFIHSITDYQAKSKKMIDDLNQKITKVEDELKIIRDHERSQQSVAIKKVDQFEQSLKHLLQSYESEANQANKKLEYMIETVKQQLKYSFKESLKIEKSSVNRLRQVANNLQILIERTRNAQKCSIDNYQRLRNIVRESTNDLLIMQHQNTSIIIKGSQKILRKIQEIQNKMNNQLDYFTLKKQSKIYEANKIVHLMIQQITNN